jgi:hypothetical protein
MLHAAVVELHASIHYFQKVYSQLALQVLIDREFQMLLLDNAM